MVPPFHAVIVELLPKVDFLFGNETEAQAWAESEGWETKDVAFIATRLSLIPSDESKKRKRSDESKKRKRTVVITQGADPTIVAVNGHVKSYPIIALPKEKLIDTNGAGDSFVGGFLAALSLGKDIEACCKAGSYAASIVVQNSGCTYPEKPDYSI